MICSLGVSLKDGGGGESFRGEDWLGRYRVRVYNGIAIHGAYSKMFEVRYDAHFGGQRSLPAAGAVPVDSDWKLRVGIAE